MSWHATLHSERTLPSTFVPGFAALALFLAMFALNEIGVGEPAWLFTGVAGAALLVLLLLRKTRSLFVVALFYLTFVVYCAPTVLFDVAITDTGTYERRALLSEFLLVQGVFLMGMIALYRAPTRAVTASELLPSMPVPALGAIASFAIAVAVVWGIEGENIFLSASPYEAYVANLETGSGLPEYLIFCIILVAVMVRGTPIGWMVPALTLLLILKLFTLGYRVQIVMACALLFFLYFERLVNAIGVLLLAAAAFATFAWYGMLKEGAAQFDLADALFNVTRGFVVSHQTGVIQSSLSVLGSIRDGLLSTGDRAWSFVGTALNAIVPSKFLAEIIPQFNIARYVQELVHTPGGILFNIPFYVWGGLPGVFVLGAAFGRLPLLFECITTLQNVGRYFWGAGAFAFLVAFPRWISYDIGNFMLRMPFMVGSCAALLYLLATAVRDRHRTHVPSHAEN